MLLRFFQVGYLDCGYSGAGSEVCSGGCVSGAPTPCTGTSLCVLESGPTVVNSFTVPPSSSLLLSPRGTWLAAGDPYSANIYLYGGITDMPSWSGTSLSTLTGLAVMAGVNNLAWSEDEAWVAASTSPGNTIVAWTSIGSTNSPIATTFPISSITGFNYAQSIAFSTDGLFLAYGEAGFSDVGIGIFGGSGSQDLRLWSRSTVGRLCCLPRDIGYLAYFPTSSGWCILGINNGFAIWCGALSDPTTWPTAPLFSTTGNYYSCGAIGLGMNGGYAILSTGNGAAVFGNGDSSVATWNGSPSVTFPATCPSQAGMYTMNYAGTILAAVSADSLYLYSGTDSSTAMTSWPTTPSQTLSITSLQSGFGILGWDSSDTWIVAADTTGAVSIVVISASTSPSPSPSSFSSPTATAAPGNSPSDSSTNTLGTLAIVGISVGGFVVLCAALGVALYLWWFRKPASAKLPPVRPPATRSKTSDVELGTATIVTVTSETCTQASRVSKEECRKISMQGEKDSQAPQVVANPLAATAAAVETTSQLKAAPVVCLQCGTTNSSGTFCGRCGASLPLDAPGARVWH